MSPQALHKPRYSIGVTRELYILWRFIDNDIWDTIMPSLLVFVTAWLYMEQPLQRLPTRLLLSLLYATLYILTFCMSNQVNSVEEDRINKPYRPLPTGLVTKKQTQIRMLVYNALFLLVAYFLQIFMATIAWQIVTALLNHYGWSHHWFTKNLAGMTIGTFLLFQAQWKIAAPGEEITDSVMAYMALMSVWAGFALPIQDFRDTEGDRTLGRKTLPLSFGDRTGRLIMVFHFLILSPLLFVGAIHTQVPLSQIISTPATLVVLLVQVLVHWAIALRLWAYRSPSQDHKTYLLYVALFCVSLPMICIL